MGFNKFIELFIILIVLLNIKESCFEKNIPVAVNSACRCGEINYYSDVGFITSGTETKPHAYPWQAYIRIIRVNATKELRISKCGGTVINDWYILTAAHCVVQRTDGWKIKRIEVFLGAHNIKKIYTRKDKHYVTKVIPHEHYFKLIRDIALLKLHRSIIFSEIISPICIPKQDSNWFDGKNVTVIGWGRTIYDDKISGSSVLLEVNLKLLSPPECWKYTKHTSIGPRYAMGVESMLCAYDTENIERNACKGDSGGPLFFTTKKRRAIQVGIVSFGRKCGVNPVVYTKVSRFTNWILRNTQDATYCVSPSIKHKH